MPLNRNIFSHEGLYVSASPSSGSQFFYTNAGSPNNDWNNSNQNINLVRPLPRVQGINYSVNFDRTEVKQLGSRSLAAFPLIAYPTVNLNFSYLSAGILNEYRLGFDVNYTQINSGGGVSGTPFYADNFGVCCISGLVTRDLQWDSSTFRNNYQDKKNYFVAVHKSGTDVNQFNVNQTPDYNNLYTYAFGDCQIVSYRAAGSVGEFPVINVGLVGSNLVVYSSGSGIDIPALDPITRNGFTGTKVVLPSTYEGSYVSVLLPGSTTVNISSRQAFQNVLAIPGTGLAVGTTTTNIPDVGIDFRSLSVQSYDVSLDLNREPLISLAARLPLDRKIVFPVYASCNFTVLVNNIMTGDLRSLFNKDDDYDISLKLANPLKVGGVGIQYDFRRAKLNGISSSAQVGNDKTVNLSFLTEINPDNLSRGFFISGSLNTSPADTQINFGALKLENNSYLLNEDGSKILLFNSIQI